MFKFSSNLRFELVQLLLLQLDAVVAALDACVKSKLELHKLVSELVGLVSELVELIRDAFSLLVDLVRDGGLRDGDGLSCSGGGVAMASRILA